MAGRHVLLVKYNVKYKLVVVVAVDRGIGGGYIHTAYGNERGAGSQRNKRGLFDQELNESAHTTDR